MAARLRLRSTNETFLVKEENSAESGTQKNSIPPSFNARTKTAESELEVFTSASLVNLVKLMHPYCLKLHVNEEGTKPRKNHTFFSQEEVWKYERPTEGSDEEINVVSDDEAAEKEAEDPGRTVAHSGKGLKSALLKGKSSKERKRVSFGPVQVASFDQTSTSSPLGETTALSGSPNAPSEAQTAVERRGGRAEVAPPKSPTKTKALSLQQYRQLRRQRQPLVEKQGDYTTKWPSLPEAPRELTPILCSQGQKIATSRPALAQTSDAAGPPGHPSRPASARRHPSEAKPLTPAKPGSLKRARTESKAPSSPARPLQGAAAGPAVAPEDKGSPTKAAAAVMMSSDPPNPVLLRVPLSQTPSASEDPTLSKSSVEPSPTELLQTRHSGANVEMPPGNKGVAIFSQGAAHCNGSAPGEKAQPPNQDLETGPCSGLAAAVRPVEQQSAEALQAKVPSGQPRSSTAVSGKGSATNG